MVQPLHRLLNWSTTHREILRNIWQAVSIGVIGLNSYLLLLNRCTDHPSMQKVVYSGTAAYAVVFLFQTLRLRCMPTRRHRVARQTRTVFRLVYTVLYLTAIMLDVMNVIDSTSPDRTQHLVYYGWNFIAMGVWGTCCLWGPGALARLRRMLVGQGDKVPVIQHP